MEGQTAQKGGNKTISLVATILLIVAGVVSIVCMCSLGVMSVEKVGSNSQKEILMLGGIIDSISEGASATTDTLPSFAMVYILASMIMGVVFGIMLLVKTIKWFKKDVAKVENWSITCALLFISNAVGVFGLYSASVKMEGATFAYTYAPFTIVGLVVVGVALAFYVFSKVFANLGLYKTNKKVFTNSIFNLVLAVVLVVMLILLSLPEVSIVDGNAKVNYSLLWLYSMGADGNSSGYMIGCLVAIPILYVATHSIHSAIKGLENGDTCVPLGPQIAITVLAFLYMILTSIGVSGMTLGKPSIAVVIVVFVFALLALATAIVHMVMFKNLKVEKAETPEGSGEAQAQEETQSAEHNEVAVANDEPASVGSSNSDDDSFGTFSF
ncbi:MAG: hypothetical protein ACI4MS_01570 [Candidatus Coproplasma sp.]